MACTVNRLVPASPVQLACVCVWSWLQRIGKLGLYTLLHSLGCSFILMMNRDESPNSQMWWVICTRSLNSHTRNKRCCHTDWLPTRHAAVSKALSGFCWRECTHTQNCVQQRGSLARSISLCHHLKKPQWVSPIHSPPHPELDPLTFQLSSMGPGNFLPRHG